MRLFVGEQVVDVIRPPLSRYAGTFGEWRKIWHQLPDDFPLQQRHDWPLRGADAHTILLRVVSEEHEETCFVGVRCHRVRALPGAIYLHLPKLGVGVPHWAISATLAALRKLAEEWFRVVRVRVELSLLGYPERLESVEHRAKALGYSVVPPLEYAHTLLVPLSPSSSGDSQDFHRSIYKNARKIERAGHVLRSIGDQRYAMRMADLYEETMRRTNAQITPPDMRAVLRSAEEHPRRYRVVALFRDASDDPEELLAFRWCGRSGQYAYDLLAASTRLVEDGGQVPMMPAIMLNMFEWAHSQGATAFDFGGVLIGDELHSSPVAGITRFKRQFGGRILRVGSDLIFEPRNAYRLLNRVRESLVSLIKEKERARNA